LADAYAHASCVMVGNMLDADAKEGIAASVAMRSASALAAKAATTTIPIVFAIGGDPIRFGLVASFARPGENITGVSFLVNALGSKRFGLPERAGADRLNLRVSRRSVQSQCCERFRTRPPF